MALRNQPYIPLYVQDFMTDEKLMRCSAEATGVYIRLMCVMHKSEQYGVFAIREKDRISENISDDFARVFSSFSPYSQDVVRRAFQELLDEEVIYIYRNWLCQKRMMKDAELSEKRAKSGKLGAQKRHEKGDEFCHSKTFSKIVSKTVANTENEIEYENEDEYVIEDDSDIETKVEVQSSSARGKSKKYFAHDSYAYLLSSFLSKRISARLPSIKPAAEKTLQSWASAFDACNRIDGHSWDEIKLVLKFSQEDSFWQQNILSGRKFREKYPQLLAKMNGKKPERKSNAGKAIEILKELNDEYEGGETGDSA